MDDHTPAQPTGDPYEPPAERRSYLLRLWRGAEGGWRASLQSIQTGERHMFADLERLLAFLIERPWPPPDHAQRDHPGEPSAD